MQIIYNVKRFKQMMQDQLSRMSNLSPDASKMRNFKGIDFSSMM